MPSVTTSWVMLFFSICSNALIANSCRLMVLGFLVIISEAFASLMFVFFSSIRRRSPSVMIPMSWLLASTTAVAPSRFDEISMENALVHSRQSLEPRHGDLRVERRLFERDDAPSNHLRKGKTTTFLLFFFAHFFARENSFLGSNSGEDFFFVIFRNAHSFDLRSIVREERLNNRIAI